MHCSEGSDFWTGKATFHRTKNNPYKHYCRYSFPKAKKAFFSNFSRTNQKQTKSKSSFLLIFLLKIAFKPNKSQKSQVSSQDHHNQNGENPLKEESIQHWASNFPSYFLYFLIILLFYSFIWFYYFLYVLIHIFLLFIWSYSYSYFPFLWDLDVWCDLKL